MITKQERLQFGPYQLVRHNGLTSYWALPGGQFANIEELNEMAKTFGFKIYPIEVDVFYCER